MFLILKYFLCSYGGPSRYFFNLFESINKKNDHNKAYIVSPVYHNEFLNSSNFREKIIGIKVPKIKFTGVINKGINKIFTKNLIKEKSPNIIHTTDYPVYFDKKRFPLVVTVHDLIHEIFYKDFGEKKIFRPKKKILDISDHIICVSENTKKDLIKFYNISDKKISVIYHGNSFENFSPNMNGFKINFKYFLYIGSRKRYKNFFNLIKAFKLNKQIYNDYKIICFGGGKLLNSEIKKFSENNIDLNKIIIYDKNDDQSLFDLYKNAEALVYPSYYEGFGMPIVEAMSLGCPVISSDSSSMPEVFGNAALTFSPSSISDLKDKLEVVAYDKEKRRKLINLGLKQSEKFTWEKCADKTLKIYNKIL